MEQTTSKWLFGFSFNRCYDAASTKNHWSIQQMRWMFRSLFICDSWKFIVQKFGWIKDGDRKPRMGFKLRCSISWDAPLLEEQCHATSNNNWKSLRTINGWKKKCCQKQMGKQELKLIAFIWKFGQTLQAIIRTNRNRTTSASVAPNALNCDRNRHKKLLENQLTLR